MDLSAVPLETPQYVYDPTAPSPLESIQFDPKWIGVLMPALFGIVIGIIYLASGRKKATQGKRCTARTVGTVVGYDSAHRKGDSIWPAILSYTVAGIEYRVSGPFFKSYVTKSVNTPFSKNSIEVSTEGGVMRVSYSLNSLASIRMNPYEQLYPRGTQLDVFYNPSDPADAYVMHAVAAGQYKMLAVVSVICLALAALALVFILSSS